jgi:5'-deoxynucleotidase YfbR-like HD superfamily hydrolase
VEGGDRLDEHKIVMRALVHDLAEIFTGDLNYWVKHHNGGDFRRAWDKMEEEKMKEFLDSCPNYVSDEFSKYLRLTCEELSVVKVADYLEFTYYCLQEAKRGNHEGTKLAKIGIEVVKSYVLNKVMPAECPVWSLLGDAKAQVRRYDDGYDT